MVATIPARLRQAADLRGQYHEIVRSTEVAILIALSIIWGSAFMLVKVVLEEVPPMTLVAGRLLGAFLFLWAALLLTGRSLPRSRAMWGTFILLGVVNNVFPFTFLTWGQQHIDSSVAAILVASMPLFTVIMAHFWINERMTVEKAVGVLVGFGGVFLLIGGSLRDLTGSSTLGQLAVIAGASGYAFGTVFARHRLRDMDPIELATGQTLVATIVAIPLALAIDQPFDLAISTKTGLAWATLGVVPSAIAYLLFFSLIKRVTATQASMVGYLIPITAVFMGAFVLDERLAATSFAGLALIIAGVWVVNGGGTWLAQRVRGEREAVEVAGDGEGG